MADDILTLKEDDGTTAHTFTKRKVDAQGETLWDNPGAGPLAGVRTLRRKSTKTRAGIVSRAVQVVIPVLNGTTGKYDSTIQGRIVLNAPEAIGLEEQEDALAMLVSAVNPTLNADFTANFVKGY